MREKEDQSVSREDRRKARCVSPFILEVQGGVGCMAIDFLVELEEKRRERSCDLSKNPISIANLELMASISIELQRLNAEMILQRMPREVPLGVKDLIRVESAHHSCVKSAEKALNAKNVVGDKLPMSQNILSWMVGTSSQKDAIEANVNSGDNHTTEIKTTDMMQNGLSAKNKLKSSEELQNLIGASSKSQTLSIEPISPWLTNNTLEAGDGNGESEIRRRNTILDNSENIEKECINPTAGRKGDSSIPQPTWYNSPIQTHQARIWSRNAHTNAEAPNIRRKGGTTESNSVAEGSGAPVLT